MKVITNILLYLIMLFFSGLLFIRLIVTTFFLIFDDYYLRIENYDASLLQTKDFQLSVYSMTLPIILISILAYIMQRKTNLSKVMVVISLFISILLFRFTYLAVFKLFSFTPNPFINIGVLAFIWIGIIMGLLILFKRKFKPLEV